MTALLLAQILFLASALALAGGLLFGALVLPRALAGLPPPDAAPVRSAIRRWHLTCLLAAVTGLFLWTVLQTAELAGALTPAALATVLTRTLFGTVVLVQLACLLAALALLSRRPAAAAAPALLAVAAQAAHGHGMAIGGPFGPLFELDLLHLLAAAVWAGGLVPLFLVTARAPVRAAALAARWFSPIGKWAVVLLLAAALLQAAGLVGSPHALAHTTYGRMVLVKAGLFSLLFAFAVLNRYRLAPALRSHDHPGARRRLLLSLGAQSLTALTTVAAAAYLGSLPPSAEMTGP